MLGQSFRSGTVGGEGGSAAYIYLGIIYLLRLLARQAFVVTNCENWIGPNQLFFFFLVDSKFEFE